MGGSVEDFLKVCQFPAGLIAIYVNWGSEPGVFFLVESVPRHDSTDGIRWEEIMLGVEGVGASVSLGTKEQFERWIKADYGWKKYK